MYCTCFIVFALLLFDPAWAANYNMSGIVDDSVSLQPIAGVVVSIANTTIQTVTDSAGRFTLKNVPAGCTICFVHISYHTTCQKWQGKDNNLLFLLPPTAVEAEKVIIINNRTNDTKRIEPGAFTIKNETLRAQPLLLGEHDVIKFLQLTPGVAKTDIAQGYIVRGGGADQNLVLLDGLPVYNPNHLFGIFSAFNSPAIQSVTLLKSGAPANYGGKLSSILEIETLKKQSKPFVADINVGMLSASAVMAQNLDSDKVSMLVSVRKSYIDELIKPAVTPFLSSNNLFSTSSTNFYDLFSKVSYRYNQSNELSMTGFTSFDKYSLNSHLAGLTTLASWQNTGGQVAWRHFGQNSFTLCRVYYSGYQFNFDIAQSGLLLSMDSHLYEVVGLLQQQFYFAKHTLKYGIEVNKYMVRPNQGNVIIENQLLNQNQVQNNHAIDASAFLSDEVQIFVKTKLVAGIRFSDILAIGPYTAQTVLYSNTIAANIIIKQYFDIEPRLALQYLLSENSSLKASFSRLSQPVIQVNLSAISLPTDMLVLANKDIAPEISDQFSLAYQRSFVKQAFDFSAEMYYKTFSNLLELKNGLLGSISESNLESSLFTGSGKAYGLELMLRKNEGHFNGWVAYTFSRSLRTFDQINNGSEFPDKYDCPNNFSLFVSGKINDHWTASASWVYATGNALTLPVSRYLIADNLVSIYSNINSLRMPAYHRADVGVTRSTQYKYFTLNFNFSVYNVYDHANPMYVYVLALCEGKGNNISVNPVVVSLMPVLPCFGIELKF